MAPRRRRWSPPHSPSSPSSSPLPLPPSSSSRKNGKRGESGRRVTGEKMARLNSPSPPVDFSLWVTSVSFSVLSLCQIEGRIRRLNFKFQTIEIFPLSLEEKQEEEAKIGLWNLGLFPNYICCGGWNGEVGFPAKGASVAPDGRRMAHMDAWPAADNSSKLLSFSCLLGDKILQSDFLENFLQRQKIDTFIRQCAEMG